MMTVMMNASTNRCQTLAWMREPEWKWHVVHTDWMGDKMPKTVPLSKSKRGAPVYVNYGINVATDHANGPNNDNERHTNGTN